MIRIIIEIDGKEFASTIINTDNSNAGITTEVTDFTSKETPPQELLNIAKSLGALSAGPAPAWVFNAQFNRPNNRPVKSEFEDQQVIDAGPMNADLLEQNVVKNLSRIPFRDDSSIETLDGGIFQDTNDR